MKNKIFLSIIISIILTYSSGLIIKNKFSEKWQIEISYEHIGRTLNENYILLGEKYTSKIEKNFSIFVTKLSDDITNSKDKNPCSELAREQVDPNIIIKFKNLKLEFVMYGLSKKLILDCENYINSKIQNYENITLKTLLTSKSKTFEIRSFVQDLIKNEIEKNIDKREEYNDSITYLENLFKINEFLEMQSGDIFTKELIINLKLMERTHRKLKLRKTNTVLINLSLFTIFQAILIILFFNKKIFNRKITLKIKKFFSD